MIDIIKELNAARREVGDRLLPAGECRTVTVQRTYDAEVADVWDALTDPERLRRWFLPVSGDLHLGGKYQLEGNAGGEILRCEPPNLLRVSWLFGEEPGFSEVEVTLAPVDGGTAFRLEHVAAVPAEMWNEFGPGATGVGWDLGLLGLRIYLATGDGVGDTAKWEATPEAREFSTASVAAWRAAHEASGVDPATAAAAAEKTRAFYVPAAD
jgi:uncharacterized protein YndB with AHSA1/START domain